MNNEEEFYDQLIKEGLNSIKNPKISDDFDQKILKTLRPRPKFRELWRDFAAPIGLLGACAGLLGLLINAFVVCFNTNNSPAMLNADLDKIHAVSSVISSKVELGSERLSPLPFDGETEALKKAASSATYSDSRQPKASSSSSQK